MDKNIRVLIVDDHPLMRKALIRTLHEHEDIEVIGEGENGDQAVAQARRLSPDVIIMDLGLPGKPGVDAIREIVTNQPDVHILVLSGKEDETTITAAVQAGAIGFLGKGDQDIDLVTAIRETYRGMATLKGETLRRLLNQKPAAASIDSYLHLLTDRERELVQMIAEGHSDQEIAETMILADSTVRSHVNHILLKLHLKSRPELLRMVFKPGLDDAHR